MIWQPHFSLQYINRLSEGTAAGNLGIEFVDLGEDWLRARMPVDRRTRQPAGVLHGGISVAFAETLASCAAFGSVDPEQFHCVGLEINANHVRAAKEGWVYGEARPLHLGRSTQVWEVRINTEAGTLVCVSRCTIAVMAAPNRYLLDTTHTDCQR